MLARRIRTAWDKAVTWYRGKTRSYIDLLVTSLLVAPLFALLLYIDAFDTPLLLESRARRLGD